MALREINLVPAELVHRKYLTRHLLLWAGCLALCLSLVLGFYLYQVYVVLPKKRPVTTMEDMHKQLGATLDEIKETQQQIERLSFQESFLAKLSRVQPFSILLLRLSEIMNAQTWLTKLSIDASTEDEDVPPSISLFGFSISNEDLGNFLTQLSEEPLFQDVGLKYAKETQITRSPQDRKALIKVIQFQIDCKTQNTSL
jgi:Tfp pilus assembly protein PilN